MRRLEGKTAVITGCNRGIGRAILAKFVSEGANIIACTRTITPELQEYYDRVSAEYGATIYPVGIDLSDVNSVSDGIKAINALKLPIHILVNNAGVTCFDGLMRLSEGKMKLVFQVNYFSPIMLAKGLIMPMMKARGASLINMTSVAGIDGTAGNCSYGASKAALILATKTLSKELAKARIRVNAIAPNLVKTDMAHQIEEESFYNMIEDSALKRLATPEEIANTALFLASEESSFITGQIIRVDGGL